MKEMMKLGTIGLVWTCVMMTSASAQRLPPASDEIKLQVTKQELDEDAAGRPEIPHAEAVGKHFKIDPRLVQALRADKQGWGEMTIRLVLAQEVCKLVPDGGPELAQTLQKIGDLRKQKQSWREIAKQLGIDLAPVVGEAQRARHELRAKAKTNAERDDRQGRGAGCGSRGRRN
jgi:hypothetical protein